MVRAKARVASICLIVVLAACGEDAKPSGGRPSGSQPGLPSEPVAQVPGTVVTPAGGTVAGPNGAQVVVPPGALATDTAIAVEQTSAGAPQLPAEVSPVGPMFAFTPHGITFAVPVTITVPFDPASVPAGATPTLHKTNAQNQWEQVPNITLNANTVSAQVTGFSYVDSGITRGSPQRQWDFYVGKTDETIPGNDFALPPWGEVHPVEKFPPATFDLDNDKKSTLEVSSSTDGVTFWAKAEEVGRAHLTQTQGFTKDADNATLKFVITSAYLEAIDENQAPAPNICPPGDGPSVCAPILAEVEFAAQAVDKNWERLTDDKGAVILDVDDSATLEGHNGAWDFDTPRFGGDAERIWSKGAFAYTEDATRTHVRAELNETVELVLDLRSITVGTTFFVVSDIYATAWNTRARESAVRAFLRDPVETGGARIESEGLTLTNESLPPRPLLSADEPLSCATGPDPAAGVLEFSAPTYRQVEGPFAGRTTVVVTRSQGTHGPVSATFSAGGGTATPGTHYRPVSRTVYFGDGDASPRTVPLDILFNAESEPDRTVNLTLSDPGGCASLGAQSSAVLTILDDDRPVVAPERFTVGGTVSGLIGTGLVLDNNDGLFLEIFDNGPFTFVDLPLPSGSPYDVGIFNRPRNPEQNCTIINGKGTFTDHNVTDVRVECV